MFLTALVIATLPIANEPPVRNWISKEFRVTTPLVDQDPESGLWALGANWKLNVRGDGATFFPLERDLPEHRPFGFGAPVVSIDGVTMNGGVPVSRLDGSDLVVDRGAIVERWNLSLQSVEQTFEVSATPHRGELLIDLPLDSNWVFRGRFDGLVFAHPGMADLRYGDVTTRDADGRSIATESEFLVDRIRLRVPADFVETARFPLVVDPILESLTVDADLPHSIRHQSTAYDPTNDRYLVTYATNSEGLSGDSDIFGALLDGFGRFRELVPIEITTQRGYTPDACGMKDAQKFGVAYQNLSSLGVNSIRVRFFKASTGALDPVYTVWTGDHCHAPAISGSIHGGAQNVLVGYLTGTIFNPSTKLHVVPLSLAGSLGTRVEIKGAYQISGLSITASDGTARRWVVSWIDDEKAPLPQLLYTRLFDSPSGAPLGAARYVDIASPPYRLGAYSIAGDGQNFVCLSTDSIDGIVDTAEIRYRELKHSAGQLVDTETSFDFGAIDDNVGDSILFGPALGLDGGRYVYAGATEHYADALAGTISPAGNAFGLLEQDAVVFANSFVAQSLVTTKYDFGGPLGQTMITCRTNQAGSWKLEGAIYQPTLSPGGVTVSQTGCGGIGAEPQISFSGALSIAGGSATISLTSQLFGSPQIWVGTPLSYQFCTACPFGVQASNIVPGNSATILNGTSPALVGSKIAIQGVVMNPLLGTKCTNLSGTTFQTSDTLIVTLQ